MSINYSDIQRQPNNGDALVLMLLNAGLAATLVVWRTKLHLLWLLGAGAVLGALGWI